MGGPTLVTTQRLTDKALAKEGWLAFPEENRFIMFDGSLLHGVVPGRGFVSDPKKCRTTFMIAFWKDITCHPDKQEIPGASRPFPNVTKTRYTWPKLLTKKPSGFGKSLPEEIEPVWVSPIWEDLNKSANEINGCGIGSLKYLPSYDVCFQGF